MRLEPSLEICIGVEIRAELEDLPKARAFPRHAFKQRGRVAVAIDHQAEIGRLRARQLRIKRAVGERIVGEENQAGVVNRVERAKGKKGVCRVGCSWEAGQSHGREQRAERGHALLRDLRDDNDIVLRDHGAALNLARFISAWRREARPLESCGRPRLAKVEAEIDQSLAVPINLAEIEAIVDEPDFVADV